MSKNNFYVGFPNFEGLLAAAGNNRTLYLSKAVTSVPAQFNTLWVYWTVTAAFFNDNQCLYWRMAIGDYNRFDAEQRFPEEAEMEKVCSRLASEVETHLTAYAKEQGFQVITGLVAFPKNLTLLKGETRLLDYNKEQKSFSRNAITAAVGG
jgi:hypothetical protein